MAARDYHSVRKYALKVNYGLTPESYAAIDDSQLGLCAICGAEGKRKLDVDHCHKTGVVRGLLCGTCNKGLGLFKDNPELLYKAIDYLVGQLAEAC